MKRVDGRFFLERHGLYMHIPCELGAIGPGQVLDIDFGLQLPGALDTAWPQRAYIVYQEAEQEEDFFAPEKPGQLLVLYGFKAVYRQAPFVLMVDAATDEIVTPEPPFDYVFERAEWVGA